MKILLMKNNEVTCVEEIEEELSYTLCIKENLKLALELDGQERILDKHLKSVFLENTKIKCSNVKNVMRLLRHYDEVGISNEICSYLEENKKNILTYDYLIFIPNDLNKDINKLEEYNFEVINY